MLQELDGRSGAEPVRQEQRQVSGAPQAEHPWGSGSAGSVDNNWIVPDTAIDAAFLSHLTTLGSLWFHPINTTAYSLSRKHHARRYTAFALKQFIIQQGRCEK